MAMNSAIHDQAYPFFIEEAPELLQAIEAGLLNISQGRDTAQIHAIMRAAHSLKGGAASVGLEAIKSLAHRLETLFKALYSEHISFDSELESQLLEAFDCLRMPLTDQLTQGHFDADQALSQAEPILSQLEERFATAINETENFIPSSADLGIDMAVSIFEVDVQQGLEHLSKVLTDPSAYEVAGELRAQMEVFVGFAELLDLPGFAQIAEMTLQALDTQPQQVLEITHQAIAAFQAGRTAVLNGAEPQPPEDFLAGIQSAKTADSLGAELFNQDSLGESLSEAEALAWLGTVESAELPLPVEDLTGVGRSTSAGAEGPAAGLEEMFSSLDDLAIESKTDSEADQQVLGPADTGDGEAESLLGTTDQIENKTELKAAATVVRPTFTKQSEARHIPLARSVRVDSQRLQRLDNYLGELTINRNGLALQKDQLRLGIKDLLGRFERVRDTIEQLQSTSNQLLITPERQHSAGHRLPAALNTDWVQPDFDSLEMDTYTVLYGHCQTLLEEMLQLEEAVEDISLFNQRSDQLLGQHGKMLSQMQDELRWARMVPLSEVLNRFPRMLRDLANTYQKPASLEVEGADLLVEKGVLEKLHDPLMHLLRNGFDHGLESPEKRQQLGKSETGQIIIRAVYRGRQVVIEVSDDGQGLDLEKIRQRAVHLGLLTVEEAKHQGAAQLSRLIFEPGFSTAAQVSELSGRGVGLDVVKEQIQQLKGTISVQSTAGKGTQFFLSLPMTLSIVNLLICFSGTTPIAFRSDSITEMLVPQSADLMQIDSQRYLRWKEQQVPLYRLADLLSYNCLVPERPLSQVLAAVPAPADWEAPALILSRGKQVFAFQVDRLVSEQESVIKPFGPALTPPSYVYGCTVLGDGSFIPVIDGQVFLDDLLSQSSTAAATAAATEVLAAVAEQNADSALPQVRIPEATTVLVVDDALTSRRTLALSLERQGYRVLQARDGQEGLEQLAQNPAVQLVICDVEMPVMNGFEFLTQRRQSAALAAIPTVMLTSRGNDKHRRLAMHLGANDYFTKPYLEQEFLKSIATYLEKPVLETVLSGSH